MSSVTLQLGTSSVSLDPVQRNRVVAGRDSASCGLAFVDPGLSRRHAEIWLEHGQVLVRDLGSSNGTWVDGQLVGAYPVVLRAGQRVYLGTVALGVTFAPAFGGGATAMVEMPQELRQLLLLRQQQVAAGGAVPAAMPMAPTAMPAAAPAAPAFGTAASPPAAPPLTGAAAVGAGGRAAPVPASLAYRRQGSNGNGVLLVALPADTFSNAATIDGYVEFTALDNENVASISVELVEFHKRGPSDGHVWDRVLVRQGPWKAAKNDVVALPFQLRVPPGTSISGREVIWELRALADINWAVDVGCVVPITMRNTDIERLRDALGALDYRIVELESAPLGQRFVGRFQPPTNLRAQWGINDIDLTAEYLGANLQVHMHVDKKGVFKRDRDVTQTYDLQRLRTAPMAEISAYLKSQIDQIMAQ